VSLIDINYLFFLKNYLGCCYFWSNFSFFDLNLFSYF